MTQSLRLQPRYFCPFSPPAASNLRFLGKENAPLEIRAEK
jgi:hypothetical protein